MSRNPLPRTVSESPNHMPTTFLLMAQYGGRTFIPIEDVCRDFFAHLTPDKLSRKVASGEVRLPLVRMEASQKAAKGVHLSDLADYLDTRRDVAKREMKAISGQ